MKTRVVNLNREPCTMRIDRTTIFGNPFRIGPGRTREQAIAEYGAWVTTQPQIVELLPQLRGQVLGCHCAPLPCHGDVLAALADAAV